MMQVSQLLLNYKNVDLSKLKVFADGCFNLVYVAMKSVYDVVENIVGKEENRGHLYFLLFIRPSKTGRIMGSPVAGGRRPVLCPEHISKTSLPRVMKFHGWIDLIVQCTGIITLACLIFELLPLVVFHT